MPNSQSTPGEYGAEQVFSREYLARTWNSQATSQAEGKQIKVTERPKTLLGFQGVAKSLEDVISQLCSLN
jgi:hypothetical protein